MNTLVRYCLLLLLLGLFAQPAYALGDQIDVWIYGALGVVILLGIGFVMGVAAFIKMLEEVFRRKPAAVSARPGSPRPDTTRGEWMILIVVLVVCALIVLVSS